MRLQFWPWNPADRLQVGERLLVAGETWVASKEDAEELLTDPLTANDVREAPEGQESKQEGRAAYVEATPEAAGSADLRVEADSNPNAQPPTGGKATND